MWQKNYQLRVTEEIKLITEESFDIACAKRLIDLSPELGKFVYGSPPPKNVERSKSNITVSNEVVDCVIERWDSEEYPEDFDFEPLDDEGDRE